MKLLFADVETTGLDCHKHGIHQLSGMIVIDGVVKCDFSLKMKPHEGAYIDMDALKASGTTIEMLEAYPPMQLVYQQFTEMLSHYVDKYNKLDKFFLVGYNNVGFDNQFLRQWFAHNGDKYFGSWFWSNAIDVMVLASHHLASIRHTMTDFKLKTVAAACGITVDETKLHQATYDIELTKQIYDSLNLIEKGHAIVEENSKLGFS